MNLQTIIREKGLTQVWVASQLGIREDSFSRIVRHETPLPLDKVEALAKLLKLSVAEVVRIATPPDATHARPGAREER